MKIIRLTILLALIVASFALDMKSAKNRAANSAYVALYTELGLTSGFKEDSLVDAKNDVIFKVYYTWEENGKKKSLGESNPLSINNFVSYDSVKVVINLPMRADLFSKLPAFLKSYCNTDFCKISGTTVFIAQKDENQYFALQFKDNKSVTHDLKIIVSNAMDGYVASKGTVLQKNLFKVIGTYEEQKEKETSAFSKIAIDLKHNLELLSNQLNFIKKNGSKMTVNLEKDLKVYKDDLDKYQKLKTALETNILNLNKKIAADQEKITLQNTLKQKCLDEQITILKQIEDEQLEIRKSAEKIKNKLALSEKLKKESILALFYQLEASYYYRVFSERLIKKQEDIDAALTGKNLQTTQNKIINAFFPIPIKFSQPSSK